MGLRIGSSARAILWMAAVMTGCGDDGAGGMEGAPGDAADGPDAADDGDADSEPPGDDTADDRARDISESDDRGYAIDPSAPIEQGCQGFELEGLMYSPGGDVLPNTCEPFHPTWNNPYAVLCVQAWPWYESGFLGDELCILPPEPGKGIQVGFHPQSPDYWAQMEVQDLSGYADVSDAFLVDVGGEETRNFVIPTFNDQPRNYYRTYFRMRTGSHHNIITLHGPSDEPRWLEATGDALPGLFGSPAGPTIGVLGGQQRPDDNTPASFEKPPEDAGLYLDWPVDPSVLFNLHHFNSTDEPILKEGWVNIWWEQDATELVEWYMGLSFEHVVGLDMAPGETLDEHYSWTIEQPIRLLRVFGHRHVWTPNFSTWIERGDGEVELIYQSFDWFDMPTYRYDSVVDNPPLNPEARVDGATSGVLLLEEGDELHFNCHMEFTDERAVAESAPMPDEIGNLRFANEAYSGEMCILFGNNTGGDIGQPSSDDGPVPDFAR